LSRTFLGGRLAQESGNWTKILPGLIRYASEREYEIPEAAERNWRILMLQLVNYPSFVPGA
jgi:hypothetical protein